MHINLSEDTEPISYVNIKQGTFSEYRFSCGNTLPIVAAPFGMNHFCLQTKGSDGGWFYHPAHHQAEGIRLTHQPSPWVGDYGHLVFMPQSGRPYVTEGSRCSGFSEISMDPSAMELYFKRYRANMKFAPSERGAVMELCWDTEATPRFAVLPFGFASELHLDTETSALSGAVNARCDGTPEDFKLYFYMKFDREVDVPNTVITHNSGETEQGVSGSGMGVGINIAFHVPKGEVLTVRMGTSFLSPEYARRNLAHEIGDSSFDAIKAQTREKWNALLSKIRIRDTGEKKQTFYSCLYRCFLFPRMFYEYGADGRAVHYCTKDGSVRPGVMYTDNGFWDTCRTSYPLFALLIPKRLEEMLQGYLNFYREEGWLPKWLSPGERGMMPGTLIDAVLADAAVKGLLSREQMELALEGMRKHAAAASGNSRNGRVGVLDYVEKGYVPSDIYHESVNNSLDAYYCDYCISRVAELLGKEDIREKFKKRSRNYQLLFDPSVGFIRGRNADGSRADHFSPFAWGGDYCEGGPWQNGFGVYHDIEGLARLYGGKDGFVAKLDELFATPPHYEIGSYWTEIHEMTEMASADFGQCAISNQPSFHLPYLYSALGYPEKTARWVSRIVNEAFSGSEKGFPGDEDNGSMSAWYVFSVLGFYPICPGKPEYVTGACGAEELQLTLGTGKVVTIRNSLEQSDDFSGIRVLVDGASCEDNRISHDQLLSAQFIEFRK